MANWPFQKKDILDETFGFDRLEELKSRISDATGADDSGPTLTASDFGRMLDGKIKCLRQRLVAEMDHPSWGPKGSKKAHEKAQKKEFDRFKSGEDLSQAALVTGQFTHEDPDGLIRISQNLDQSERYFKYSFLYLGAAIIGLLITAGALYVDYEIMNEFWTRVLANEFMEVPPSLANSVISKSAQVIFATAAFHFFLSKLPEWGRTIYIVFFFTLTVIMISGFGLLNANISMPTNPNEISITGNATAEEPGLNDALAALGLAEPTEPVVAAPVAEEPRVSQFADVGYAIEDTRPFMWMFVPGLVFLVVTGIGALALNMAEHNLQNFVKSLDYPGRKKRVDELNEMRRFRAVVQNMGGNASVTEDQGGNTIFLRDVS